MGKIVDVALERYLRPTLETTAAVAVLPHECFVVGRQNTSFAWLFARFQSFGPLTALSHLEAETEDPPVSELESEHGDVDSYRQGLKVAVVVAVAVAVVVAIEGAVNLDSRPPLPLPYTDSPSSFLIAYSVLAAPILLVIRITI